MRQKRRCVAKKANLAAIAIVGLLGVFLANTQAQAQKFDVLYTFDVPADGWYGASLIRDGQGNLYGTAQSNGFDGVVFKVDTAGQYSVLYTFRSGQDGGYPNLFAPLVQDAAGNLYGTTFGDRILAASTIFKIDKNNKETVLHTFPIQGTSYTDAPVIRDEQGNLYGTEPLGPNNTQCNGGCGLVYKLSPKGKFTVLHAFNGNDGAEPEGGLVRDGKGNLYGVTWAGANMPSYCNYGGPFLPQLGCGTIFEIDKNGKYTILYRFKGKADGAAPMKLIRDDAGNLYGLSQFGGDLNCEIQGPDGCGTIFKLDTKGKFHVLFTYHGPSHFPIYADLLLRDRAGNLYGSKWYDGPHGTNSGFLFKLTPGGKFEDIYDFQRGSSRGDSLTGLVMDPSGTFYGTTLRGGNDSCNLPFDDYGCGTVFKLSLK